LPNLRQGKIAGLVACIAVVSTLCAGFAAPNAATEKDGDRPQLIGPSDTFLTEQARRLDALFEQLKSAENASEAQAFEQAIWQTWLRSGEPPIDALMGQAVTAMSLGKFRRALQVLDNIVERRPNFAEGWNKRATVLYLVGEYDRSLADIDRVLAIEPRHFGAISGIALIRLEQGQNEAAIDAVRQALEIHPFLPGAARLLERAGIESTDPI